MKARSSRAIALAAAGLALYSSGVSAQQRPADIVALKRDLPVVEAAARGLGQTMVVFISGDGGWAAIEKEMTAELNDHGVSVVGLDLREYLRRKQRTPDDVGRDVARIFRTYSDMWARTNIVLLGFSRGAAMTPFVLTRLPQDLRPRLALAVFVGMPRVVNMKFHWIDVIRDVSRADDLPVLPELGKAGSFKMLCVFGAEEAQSGCRAAPAGVRRIEFPGGHHLEHAYRAISDSVLKNLSR